MGATPTELQATRLLRRADIDLDQLEVGVVLYVTWDPGLRNYVTTTVDDYEAFKAISCDGY